MLGEDVGVTLRPHTCCSSQLQRGLCVVLHPFLQGALHVGFGIQQQLQQSGGDMETHNGRGRETETEGERGESQLVNVRCVGWYGQISCLDLWLLDVTIKTLLDII